MSGTVTLKKLAIVTPDLKNETPLQFEKNCRSRLFKYTKMDSFLRIFRAQHCSKIV